MPDRLRELLGGPPDLVLSDMAPNTTGHSATDHIRIVALAELALHFRHGRAGARAAVLLVRSSRVGPSAQLAGTDETGLRDGAPCQTARESEGFERALCAGYGVSRATVKAGEASPLDPIKGGASEILSIEGGQGL